MVWVLGCGRVVGWCGCCLGVARGVVRVGAGAVGAGVWCGCLGLAEVVWVGAGCLEVVRVWCGCRGLPRVA